METVQLSSSEDDDDIYLNSVAKLKGKDTNFLFIFCLFLIFNNV